MAREGRDRFTLYVRTEGSESSPLPIQKASQGTLSVIAMFGLIYEFLKSLRQETAPEVCKRRGIILIDEVDAHLHPMWQQKIVNLLRNRFPLCQFIITAHNPIAVAGCLEDEVTVLRKSPDRGFTLFQFPNDFIGWQTEDIYRKVFGIEDPDASFATYDAMRPFKAQLEQQAAGLASQSSRNQDDDRSLNEIEDKILYIERAEQTRSRRLTQEELERENRTLRDRVVGLESAHQSAAEKQRELDRVKAELNESKAALHKSEVKRLRALAALIMTMVSLGGSILYLATHPKPRQAGNPASEVRIQPSGPLSAPEVLPANGVAVKSTGDKTTGRTAAGSKTSAGKAPAGKPATVKQQATGLLSAQAMKEKGDDYYVGRGVAKDYGQAVTWYRKAADAGNEAAMNNLGSVYQNGLGVAKDQQQAMRWYLKAAGGGNAAAMNNLGFMYENGLGVEKDQQQAMRWYRQATQLGDEHARDNLMRLGGR